MFAKMAAEKGFILKLVYIYVVVVSFAMLCSENNTSFLINYFVTFDLFKGLKKLGKFSI